VRVSLAGSQQAVGWLYSLVSTLLLCSQKLLQVWSQPNLPTLLGSQYESRLKLLDVLFRNKHNSAGFEEPYACGL